MTTSGLLFCCSGGNNVENKVEKNDKQVASASLAETKSNDEHTGSLAREEAMSE